MRRTSPARLRGDRAPAPPRKLSSTGPPPRGSIAARFPVDGSGPVCDACGDVDFPPDVLRGLRERAPGHSSRVRGISDFGDLADCVGSVRS